MMKKCLIATLGVFLLTGIAIAADKVELKDETAKISYSLGYQIGGDFKTQGVGITPEAVVQGIQDALAASEPMLTQSEMNSLLVSLKQKVVTAQRQVTFQNTKEFMATNLEKEGVKELLGGSQYRVITAGSGASPSMSDTVDLHFVTKRADGTVMASTRTSDTPRTYPVSKMLPGLRQALLKMKPGDKWEVFVPPSGRTESMEQEGVLIYEVELLAVHPSAEQAK
jgi:FKBP-type peptidyl-prolyl cis-trans isomerase FklB